MFTCLIQLFLVFSGRLYSLPVIFCYISRCPLLIRSILKIKDHLSDYSLDLDFLSIREVLEPLRFYSRKWPRIFGLYLGWVNWVKVLYE